MALLSLPNLAWVALSDNPFLFKQSASVYDDISLLHILKDPILDDTAKGEILGTGASGTTHKKAYRGAHVAVKTYVGKITSDGNPEEERKISLLASSLGCDSLITVMGQTAKGALVMEYLEDYSALSNPPSMKSCTRDIYPESSKLTSDEAMIMILSLLDALAKLHKRGICHGDFYGHNILIPRDRGGKKKMKLSDFGAAFM